MTENNAKPEDEQLLEELCPEFGKNCDPEDEQCSQCDVLTQCQEKQNQRKGNRKMKKGAQAEAMNNCLNKGMTLDAIASEVGVSKTRVKGHIRHLITKRGLNIVEENGVFKTQEEQDI